MTRRKYRGNCKTRRMKLIITAKRLQRLRARIRVFVLARTQTRELRNLKMN